MIHNKHFEFDLFVSKINDFELLIDAKKRF